MDPSAELVALHGAELVALQNEVLSFSTGNETFVRIKLQLRLPVPDSYLR